MQEEFEDTTWVIILREGETTQWSKEKGQPTIYKALHKKDINWSVH